MRKKMFCDRLSLVLLATSCFGAASVLAEDRANFYLNCDGDVEIEAPPGKITSAGPPVTTPVSQPFPYHLRWKEGKNTMLFLSPLLQRIYTGWLCMPCTTTDSLPVTLMHSMVNLHNFSLVQCFSPLFVLVFFSSLFLLRICCAELIVRSEVCI